MSAYVKWVGRRGETFEDKEKGLPVSYLGRTMVGHGEDFEPTRSSAPASSPWAVPTSAWLASRSTTPPTALPSGSSRWSGAWP